MRYVLGYGRSRGHRDVIFEFQVGFCDSFSEIIGLGRFCRSLRQKIFFSFFFVENRILRASNEQFFRKVLKYVKNTFFKHFLGKKMQPEAVPAQLFLPPRRLLFIPLH